MNIKLAVLVAASILVAVPVTVAASTDDAKPTSYPSLACEQAEQQARKAWDRAGKVPHGPYVPLAACAK